jgi:hypothetical protein
MSDEATTIGNLADRPFRKETGAIDWDKVHLAYINTAMTPLEFAQHYEMEEYYVTLRKYSSERGWVKEREAVAREAHLAAQKKITEERANELAEFNKADLTMAKAIRGIVAARVRQLQEEKNKDPKFEINAGELRTLASTVESAQRVGRLALGINTVSHEVTGKDGAPLAAPTIVIGGPGEADEPSLDEVEEQAARPV